MGFRFGLTKLEKNREKKKEVKIKKILIPLYGIYPHTSEILFNGKLVNNHEFNLFKYLIQKILRMILCRKKL